MPLALNDGLVGHRRVGWAHIPGETLQGHRGRRGDVGPCGVLNCRVLGTVLDALCEAEVVPVSEAKVCVRA